MKILKTQVINGPNYWSSYRKKLIVIKLDLEEYTDSPSDELPGFNDRLKALLPSLYYHRCSPGVEGGFFTRLESGTWLGHIIEHVALELQCLAGMDCGFGRTYTTDEESVYQVVFSYQIEDAGLYAGTAAVNIISCLAAGKIYENLINDITTLKNLFEKGRLGPSTQAIVDEAEKRNIPIFRHKDTSMISLGYGKNQKKMWATITSMTSAIGVDIAKDKALTKQILNSNGIPIPQGQTVRDVLGLEQAIDMLGFPVVIKPLDGNHGRGVSTNIQTKEKALVCFTLAKKFSDDVIIEQFIPGFDYRFLVINYKVVAVAKRTPAMIMGNGKNTIQQLIDKINQDPNRGNDHNNRLTTIKIDEVTLSILKEKNLRLSTILPNKQRLFLKDSANLSAGGTATDVTEDAHPANLFLAERIARLVDLDICGIDIVAKNSSAPVSETNGAVIEVNASPGLRMHLAPNKGLPRNVAKPIVDMLFPEGTPTTIPIVAVTGTNGKTTVVRLIAHLAKQVNYHVGYTTTEGIYLNEQLICKGDCSGPMSARAVLQDPTVNFAVLECARGGILRQGLGFNECDISIITNITSDHLGLNDIHSFEDLTRIKGVVAHSTKKEGYAILNADDQLVYALKEKLKCNIALFSRSENERINQHCMQGGLAAYIKNGVIILRQSEERNILAKVKDVPITFHGSATCMIENLLATILAGVISKFSLIAIKKALLNFWPTPENLPGRMNMFKFPVFQVMIDYAHNEGAFLALKNYLNTLHCNKRVAVIGAPGDRRDEDLELIGYHTGSIFDEIIIRHDGDGRGRTNEQITELLLKGIHRSRSNHSVKIISNETKAIQHVLANALPNTFIFCAVEDVFAAIELVKAEEQRVNQQNEVFIQ